MRTHIVIAEGGSLPELTTRHPTGMRARMPDGSTWDLWRWPDGHRQWVKEGEPLPDRASAAVALDPSERDTPAPAAPSTSTDDDAKPSKKGRR